MHTSTPFKWRHFQADIILLRVRWYFRYPLSYRDMEEMMLERGLHIDHTTIYRWVLCYAPELEKRCRSHLKATNDSWRIDETYVKVKKGWMYLYRAVDSEGNTLEFLLSPRHDAEAAKRFFAKALAAPHNGTPRVITVDKNAAYPKAFKYLNNLVEQDHRFMKRLVKLGMGFFSFQTVWRTLQGYETMNMLRKGQIRGIEKVESMKQVAFIASLFGVDV
jgi:IS6 family transposase